MLVPVRLETRFVAPGSVAWRLRVRVVPDAVSITQPRRARRRRSSSTPSRRCGAPPAGASLESAEGRRAWRALAAAVGAERAAWLARTFPPVTGPDGRITINRPAETRSEMRAPRVMGLPPAMEIWIARGGQPPAQAATLTVLADEIVLDLDDPDSTDQPWWTSFAEAQCASGSPPRSTSVPRCPTTSMPCTSSASAAAIPAHCWRRRPTAAGWASSGRARRRAPWTARPPCRSGDVDTWRQPRPGRRRRRRPAPSAVSDRVDRAPVVRGVVGGEADHTSAQPRPRRRCCGRRCGATRWPTCGATGRRPTSSGCGRRTTSCRKGRCRPCASTDQPYGLLPATSLHRWRAARGRSGDRGAARPARPPARRDVGGGGRAAGRVSSVGRVARPRPQPDGHALRLAVDDADDAGPRRVVPVRPGRSGRASSGRGGRGRRGETPRLDPAAAPARQLVAVGWAARRRRTARRPGRMPTLGRGPEAPGGGAGRRSARRRPRRARAPASPPWGTSVLTELARHSLVATRGERRPPHRRPAAQHRRAGRRRRAHADADRDVGVADATHRRRPADRPDGPRPAQRDRRDCRPSPSTASATSTAACAPRSTPRRTGSTRGRPASPGAG